MCVAFEGVGMAYLLFVSSSGADTPQVPYEVVAGVAIEDRDAWNLSQALVEAEMRFFGRRLDGEAGSPRARRLLKRKVFRLATQLPPLPGEERRSLARTCLETGARAGRREMTALAQAKLAFVGDALDLAARFRCRFIASIVGKQAPRPGPRLLRKDYAYLFERFFYLVDDLKPSPLGIVVSTERAGGAHVRLAEQMNRYFRGTGRGRQRASAVIPEPFAVGGELSACVGLAGLVAYLIVWAFRTRELVEPARRELGPFKEQVRGLRYRAVREMGDNPNFVVWGFAVVPDVRMREDRDGG
jgi:hypothetical protein